MPTSQVFRGPSTRRMMIRGAACVSVVVTLAGASGSFGSQPASSPASTPAPTAVATPLAVATAARPTSLPARPEDLAWWPASSRGDYAAKEAQLLAIPTRDNLLKWHQLLASEPHVAGSVGDERTIARIMEAFKDMGLEVERHDFWPLLSKPISASLEVVEPEKVEIQIKETPIPGDAFSGASDMTFGWNAYSGSGDVTAEIVYANYGTKADFEQLKKMGVDCTGKIVLARYGGNFRGLKVKFAQAAGAAGIIIFTDPGDSGYMKGLMYPEGGYANDCCIQRGSVTIKDQPGDPLTPGTEATEHATRIGMENAGLPSIPVQPIGWGGAKEIISRMTGEVVPENWQGGLPFTYRLTGGPALKVRLAVQQERAVTKTSNVIARLKGTEHPEQLVIIGAHHDAWNCGASDPLCGTICVLEAARAFSEMAKQGWRPARTIVFAAWGAEEFGIIGSTEWVEARRKELFENGVAYLNLDMAVMGPDFGSSATPALQRVITEASRRIPQARNTDGLSVFDVWTKRSPAAGASADAGSAMPSFGEMGGGSDHVAFNCHVLVPSMGFGSGGSKGWSYHSAYDTLPWYWKVVGDDYEPGLMVTRMSAATIARLAFAPMVPLDPARALVDMQKHLLDLSKRGTDLGVWAKPTEAGMASEFSRLAASSAFLAVKMAQKQGEGLRAVQDGSLTGAELRDFNRWLLGMNRAWSYEEGLPGREWNKNLFAATDPDSGYGAWVLPGLRGAVESKDASAVSRMIDRYEAALDLMGREVEAAMPEPK